MKTLVLGATLVALVIGTLPASAAVFEAGSRIAGMQAFDGPGHGDSVAERRGRGRDDRGGDDRRGDRRGRGADDDRRDDSRSGGRHGGRARVPGGSGCDDAHDIAEHPQCRG
ncbi:hypothetical protein [Rubellimicrobium arenae]|uniref:hypothetical protein n=1 Tax=Rubellimicrobium arenae TaxID=2817372 RepID=UPI001B30450D|nr:hypothetical protein [Rubellimicrobium arenae]